MGKTAARSGGEGRGGGGRGGLGELWGGKSQGDRWVWQGTGGCGRKQMGVAGDGCGRGQVGVTGDR